MSFLFLFLGIWIGYNFRSQISQLREKFIGF